MGKGESEMLEGLWTVSFQSIMGNYMAGVLIFKEGRIYGGDATYYYLGDYVVQKNRITGQIEITHYGGPTSPIFGPMEKLRVTVTGKAKEPEMTLLGYLNDNPKFCFQAVLNKRIRQ
jgi:hypothetical protein